LSAETNINIGKALQPLREEGVFILGSGYTFHNMGAFFNPTPKTIGASREFNLWLKSTITKNNGAMNETTLTELADWEAAPGGRISHPREEHLLPLFVVAGASLGDTPQVIYDTTKSSEENELSEHAVTGYLFQ
jgi:4,5-DOPA dioxygenase extradiol